MNNIQSHIFDTYFKYYIDLAGNENYITILNSSFKEVVTLISSLTEEQANYKYHDNKWTIKELLLHIVDTERIFCERALRFARNDNTNLPGFNHNEYVKYSNANARCIKSILEEYKTVRQATTSLFENFSKEMLTRNGTANGNKLTVLSIAYIIVGHEKHHLKVIKEKYLN